MQLELLGKKLRGEIMRSSFREAMDGFAASKRKRSLLAL